MLKRALKLVIPKRLHPLIADFRRSLRRKYVPPGHITHETWEQEYAGDRWAYLEDTGEVARYGIIAGYCGAHKPNSAVLDIGCGTGIMARRLAPIGFSSYLGVDLSERAVAEAQSAAGPKVRFEAGDADTFPLNQIYDIIIFNEVIYYLNNPRETLLRYAKHLASDGIIIISVFTTPENFPVWDAIEDFAPLRDAVGLENKRTGLTWTVKVYTAHA